MFPLLDAGNDDGLEGLLQVANFLTFFCLKYTFFQWEREIKQDTCLNKFIFFSRKFISTVFLSVTIIRTASLLLLSFHTLCNSLFHCRVQYYQHHLQCYVPDYLLYFTSVLSIPSWAKKGPCILCTTHNITINIIW